MLSLFSPGPFEIFLIVIVAVLFVLVIRSRRT